MNNNLNLLALVSATQNCPAIIGRLYSIYHSGSMSNYSVEYNLKEALEEAQRLTDAIKAAYEGVTKPTIIIAEAAE